MKTWTEIMDCWHDRENQPDINFTHTAEKTLQGCGDIVRIDLEIKNNIIVALKSSGRGCVLSQAIAASLHEDCIFMSVEEAKVYNPEYDFQITRLGCSMLPILTLREAICNGQR